MGRMLYRALFIIFSIHNAHLAAADGAASADDIFSKVISCRHATSGYATDDIDFSEIYSSTALGTKGPLKVTQIHTYNPALHPVAAFKIPKERSVLPDFLADYRERSFELFVVIDRPVYDATQPQCLRPHYVTFPAATTTSNISEVKQVFVHDGSAVKMTGTAGVHVHNNVCSPSNMHMPWLDLSDEKKTYDITSAVQLTPASYAITFHYVPTQSTYDGIIDLLTREDKPIETVKDLLSKVLLLSVAEAAEDDAAVERASASMGKILALFGGDSSAL